MSTHLIADDLNLITSSQVESSQEWENRQVNSVHGTPKKKNIIYTCSYSFHFEIEKGHYSGKSVAESKRLGVILSME